ncbi:LysM peptidoglycan-binding domain-containing protein [Clostridium sp. CM028]|uniref:LysM peptidoglycan-binding domain-containing protein n=1 Tax=unclassified Clostridium TaxID=2614128 RepID=UPI001C0CEA27|nr:MULTISPECIES: LysM peptidoglycan-binding domain-containing protein [unclassified Clostridium]MBU3093802.1 LysM peptidoglycan-binding domain-containing protein [Clostridium sp. CF011]MBW9150000.1 LysM peptidoglycan-binding domain-containing protein [Clostridium sp. CM028]WAG68826.1 LysM peptidoglycan-binding domain-containing protein [Clostridium sp. CF011]WLC60600.1 LysM peptidoglycan-binding domain-containing protein [Clostridium sp. CM028]
MSMKKGIISISTIAVVMLGVFFSMKFIGGRENVANVKLQDDSIVQSNKIIPTDNNETVTNKNTQGESTNEMDAAYINDKTNVGMYTVKENDTVFSIVKTYTPSQDKSKMVEFIKSRNGINESYKIAAGQKIVIPYEKAIKDSTAVVEKAKTDKTAKTAVVKKSKTGDYTVKSKDTLTSIAKNNMTSYNVKKAIEMLKETNKITNEDAIKEGTIINIPK